MWRIFGLIFYKDKEKFFDKSKKTVDKSGIQHMLSEYKIKIERQRLRLYVPREMLQINSLK